PVRWPNVYGIDMPTREELIAHDRSVEAIREYIGADALIYQDVDAMKRVIRALNPKLDGLEASCFDGHYITGDIRVDDLAAPQPRRTQMPADDGRDEDGEGGKDDRAHSRLSLHGGTRT
ncbi:MAG TPA: hypothetical protein PKO45_08465, partial [Rubrivivax sp.]|nr:hypothetical protein [Rubrivivax sp.]